MDKNTEYDLQAKEVMRRKLEPDATCIDVGCHAGSFMDEFLSFAPKGKHYGFEPLPEFCELLRKKYEKNSNVNLFQVALSDADGKSSFTHVVKNPGYSGLRERRYDQPHEKLEQLTVAVKRLDSVVPVDQRVDLVKIDVEGAELQVLLGGIGILRRWRPLLIFEFGLGAADCYGTTPTKVYNFLCERMGYELYLMGQWLVDGGHSPLTLEQLNEEFESGSNFYFMAIA